MEQRRLLAYRVLEEGLPLSAAAREFGVCRNTAKAWSRRAEAEGIAQMRERSRRPLSSPGRTEEWVERALLEAKAERPYWGAKKLLAWLWGDRPPVSLSTANRVLARAGLSVGRPGEQAPLQRFEREAPNELWQADFKGISRRAPYSVLSVLDDSSRYLVALRALPSESTQAVWGALWEAFGECGLPERLLTDNGGCFSSGRSPSPSPLEAMLWRAGVRTSHGRPRHPQTQGKVERFHRTLQLELGEALVQPSLERAGAVLEAYRASYNWERPHQALGMRAPGQLYRRSERPRPPSLPEHAPQGTSRKVDAAGRFSYRGDEFRAGKGLLGERVEIRELETGPAAFYAEVMLGHLQELKLVKIS